MQHLASYIQGKPGSLKKRGLTVHLRRVDRPAGPALLDASRLAAAMVVGSRSAARFVGLPLGSVSRSLVHRAYCPVFVVH